MARTASTNGFSVCVHILMLMMLVFSFSHLYAYVLVRTSLYWTELLCIIQHQHVFKCMDINWNSKNHQCDELQKSWTKLYYGDNEFLGIEKNRKSHKSKWRNICKLIFDQTWLIISLRVYLFCTQAKLQMNYLASRIWSCLSAPEPLEV